MTKEELKGTKIWFGEDKVLRNKIFNKLTEIGVVTKYWRTGPDYNPDAFFYVIQQQDLLWTPGDQEEEYKKGKYKEITPSQLLGETEEWEPKVGDWVVGWHVSSCDYKTKAWKVIEIKGGQAVPQKEWGTTFEHLRPARPEEIPQEEVEFVECVDPFEETNLGEVCKIKGKYIINNKGKWLCQTGSFYGEKFKPSTREAYEAQQRKQKCIESFSEVNKCSTINTNQNECKNENKSIKVRGSGISISTVSRARGKSLCSSGGKISLGTYYSRNKQKPCNSKA